MDTKHRFSWKYLICRDWKTSCEITCSIYIIHTHTLLSHFSYTYNKRDQLKMKKEITMAVKCCKLTALSLRNLIFTRPFRRIKKKEKTQQMIKFGSVRHLDVLPAFPSKELRQSNLFLVQADRKASRCAGAGAAELLSLGSRLSVPAGAVRLWYGGTHFTLRIKRARLPMNYSPEKAQSLKQKLSLSQTWLYGPA